MKKSNCIGVCMDHSEANLMEFTIEPITTKTIYSKFNHLEKEDALKKSESLMHNKEKGEMSVYYKKLSKILQPFTEILLFGHSEAKVELFHLLKADSHFAAINITLAQTDKMTENQQHAYVREHFSRKMNLIF